jgi:putative chitinase
MIMFSRKVFFDVVRGSLFHGAMTQQQVEGMEGILSAWEANPRSDNLRHLSYPMATTAHETGFTMWPIEEYGKGDGMQYGEPDPTTGHAYYGRGFVQLTWADNYKRCDEELGLEGGGSCYWHPELQLEPKLAAETMFQGMEEGWFRGDEAGRQTLTRYFDQGIDDPYGAREIINGDKSKVPSWSGGVSIGNLIKGYHVAFLNALEAAQLDEEIAGVFVQEITATSRAAIETEINVVDDRLQIVTIRSETPITITVEDQ